MTRQHVTNVRPNVPYWMHVDVFSTSSLWALYQWPICGTPYIRETYRKDRFLSRFLDSSWVNSAHLLSISFNKHTQPDFIHTTTVICMGIVAATAGLWAAKGLWQFVPVCAGYYQFVTVCDSLWQPARHILFVTVTLPTLSNCDAILLCMPLVTFIVCKPR